MMPPVEISRPVLVVETDPTLVVSGVTMSLTSPNPSVFLGQPTNAQLGTRTSSKMLLDAALNVNSSMDVLEEDTVDVKIPVNVMLNIGLLIAHV